MTDFDDQIAALHVEQAAADRRVLVATHEVNHWTSQRKQLEAEILELAEQKLKEKHGVVDVLTVNHVGSAWIDAHGDRWEYRDGAWWCREGEPLADFGPYRRVEVTVDTLLYDPQHRTSAWIDREGDRWEWREGKWQWCDEDGNWHPRGIIKPDSGEGPYVRVIK